MSFDKTNQAALIETVEGIRYLIDLYLNDGYAKKDLQILQEATPNGIRIAVVPKEGAKIRQPESKPAGLLSGEQTRGSGSLNAPSEGEGWGDNKPQNPKQRLPN